MYQALSRIVYFFLCAFFKKLLFLGIKERCAHCKTPLSSAPNLKPALGALRGIVYMRILMCVSFCFTNISSHHPQCLTSLDMLYVYRRTGTSMSLAPAIVTLYSLAVASVDPGARCPGLNLTLLLYSWVTEAKLLHLPVPRFPICKMGVIIVLIHSSS